MGENNKNLEMNDYDEKITGILKYSSKPLSSFAISILTGLRHDRVCKKLKNLCKYSIVECVTAKKVRFWRLKLKGEKNG